MGLAIGYHIGQRSCKEFRGDRGGPQSQILKRDQIRKELQINHLN